MGVHFNLPVHDYRASHLGERSGDGSGIAPITHRLTLKVPSAAMAGVYSHVCGAQMMCESFTQLRVGTMLETLSLACVGAIMSKRCTGVGPL
jgi:hypothetical protein